MKFMDGDTKSEPAKREEEILAFWQRNEIFEKTLSKEAPKGEFVFYDGPPFATGLPHYGHILAGTIKDAIPRYKTMQGYHVPRRWGWDCHGLPLENQIEKELGLATKRDIETLGVATFNEAARKAVLRYSDDWKSIIPRFGRWVDMENDYRTMDATYTESVWWAFKDLHKKGLVYEGFKAMHLCPRCGTTLSNFEVAQGYKDITDISVTVKLELVDEPGTFLLAWTTTPWTLPGNMAAAVNAEFTYVKISAGNEKYILAKDRLEVIKVDYKIEKEFLGSELVGKSYKPPFSYFADHNIKGKEKAWKVYHAPYVTMDSGTGLVHLAPAFGAEDLELAQKEGIPIVHHVDKDGFFVDAVSDFKGLQAKPKDDPQSTDVAVIKYLAGKGLLFAKEKIIHSYPHCWRCDTPLLNYASSSWFVEVTKFKDKIVAENKKINWVPKEVGDKRFGNWLLNARDWAISRARYWGAPIPVWRNHKTKENVFIGSLDELKSYTKKSGNKYFTMRHGESTKNVAGIIRSRLEDDDIHLTEKGRAEALASANAFKHSEINRIVVSPFIRAKETAEIAREVFGLPKSSVSYDERLIEYRHGTFDRKPERSFWDHYVTSANAYEVGPESGESAREMGARMAEVLYELEQKYKGENILIVSHEWPLLALTALAHGYSKERTVRILNKIEDHIQPGEIRELPFVPLPHNENFELDYHRPYIDEVVLIDTDGTRLERVHDVFDCWFESGSMSYAQNHYPFENKNKFDPKPGWLKKSRGYPADFIAEGLDQTRGWFYSLLVLGVGLFGKATYKNVIVNGIVLAEDGQKMSKRLKNYPDPLTVLEKYGADAIRYYLLASPLMKAEDLNFSEKGVGEVASKLIGRFLNVVSFYELYKDLEHGVSPSSHPLDRWIFSRLNQVIGEVEKGMESYELDKATRPLTLFVDDLSTWYLRRSRDRFKEEGADARDALQTLRSVIEIFAKISAPFMPFVAESAYQRVKTKDMPESVHLCEWPRTGSTDAPLQEAMVEVRRIASRGLEARQKVDIKVRQPLAKITVNSELLAGRVELLQLIKDELNVKEVVIDGVLSKDEAILDTDISDELKEEGNVREVIRFIQELRKEAGLTPKETATLVFVQSDDIEKFLEKHWHTLSTATRLSSRELGNGTNELVFDGMTFRFNVRS
ncbi:MAG: isoleucyl-tRNA synthetase [Parcubacteria group bacterium Greene0714_7]|nr:MAG: isoleucyl-tRNA synthetase [Parcubacteria group bacterium Greene0714_7]